MDQLEFSSIILDFIHNETGWGNPLRPYSEFEDLELLEILEFPDDILKIVFRYHFDEDGFSQYDKTHVLDGEVIISSSGDLSEFTLREVHTGVAANRPPYHSIKGN